ncbi:MAG: hypothetical protein AAGB24_05890 [Bacteroidota bacterium]
MKSFENLLTGGHPNSLGNTVQVVDQVLKDPEAFDELFHCYFSEDAVVRLRVSNAMKRICKARKELLLPYIDRFLEEISKIDQASTQWTLAQLFLLLEKDMGDEQVNLAKTILKHNLAHHHDWIVLNETMKTLGKWAKKDVNLKIWLGPHLESLIADPRKSVAKTAQKMLGAIS